MRDLIKFLHYCNQSPELIGTLYTNKYLSILSTLVYFNMHLKRILKCTIEYRVGKVHWLGIYYKCNEMYYKI